MRRISTKHWFRLLCFPLLLAFLPVVTAVADSARPWTFWYWMYGAVSKEGIKADLEAMKQVGLGGCYLMPIRGIQEAPANLPALQEPPAQQLTPRFWEMVDYAMQQADSIGLELGIHVCDGFALAGGPWISPEESMQQVVWTDTLISLGGKVPASTRLNTKGHTSTRLNTKGPASTRLNLDWLPAPATGPGGYYEDIATFACPVWGDTIAPVPSVSGTIPRDENGTFRSKATGYIQYDYLEPITVRRVEIIPNGNNVQAQRLLVQASDDGVSFRDLRQLTPPRQGWQNTDQNYTYSLPETTARHFRFCWTPEGTEPGAEDMDAAKWSPVLKVKDIRLSSEPVIDQYESKNGSVWRIAAPYVTDSRQHDGKPILLTEGTVLPPGTYRIIRFGHTSTGHTNATAGGAKGFECDKFSAAAVSKQIDSWFGEFMKRPHHQVVKYMHVDSWECGSQNWSMNFAEEFLRRRGYDLLPFLPVYAGVPMENAEQVLRDIRLTINDLINDVFFATVAQKAREYGVQLSSESVAPTMVCDGMEHYKYVDLPMGEYWLNSPTHDKPNDMLDAISGAHVYGKDIVQAEGFTEVRGVWDETPAMIKPLLDRNFALGMNRLFFHVFTHNPWTDRKPGMTLDGIGLFFQRDQTWFAEANGLVDYVTRCQRLLQRGKPVVDIAVYTGEEIPCRALTPDKLVPMLPGIFGPERVASEQERLANHGFPMTESPVGVKHSAGILDLKDWVNPLHGYQYDSMNKDALLHQPFHYKVLVIPEGCRVSDEAKNRIEQLRQQGVVIIDKPYTEKTIAGVPPDVKMSYGDGIAYTHRRDGNTDIYFFSNQTYREEPVLMSFNISGRQATCYDAVTDEYYRPNSWERNGHTVVECGFPGVGSSVFIIFSDSMLTKPADDAMSLEQEPAISGPWTIDFKESGLRLTDSDLTDWSQHPDDKIRYFSGHARYTTPFKYKGKKKRVLLDLGTVHDVAHVWVNGVDCGIAWTAPYEVDISKAVKKGKNLLEIEVVNTWHNALRGADQGKPPYDGIWTNAKYRDKVEGDGLLPAGLLGKVTLITEN